MQMHFGKCLHLLRVHYAVHDDGTCTYNLFNLSYLLTPSFKHNIKYICFLYETGVPYMNLYAEYIMRNAGLDEAQAGIKIAGRNISNLRYADDTTLMAESEELKSLLMKVRQESKMLA